MKNNRVVASLPFVLAFVNLTIAAPPLDPPRSSALVDSSSSQSSMGTQNECLAYNPVFGGLVFVCRGFSSSGVLNVHSTDSVFSYWVNDWGVYGQDFGPARYPSAIAADAAPYISFPYLYAGAWGGAAGQYCSGGWYSSAWDPPVDLYPGNGYVQTVIGKEAPNGNIVIVLGTTDNLILFRTYSAGLATLLGQGTLATGYTIGGFDVNGDYLCVFYYDSSFFCRISTDGITWGPQEPDSIIWPQPYPNSIVANLQMALTNDGSPILVFNVINGDDPQWPYYGKTYVNVAPAETCIEVSSTFGMPDTECYHCSIASGITGNDNIAVIYCTPRNDLPDSLCFWDIFYNHSADNGITWSAPINISASDTNNHYRPQLARRSSGHGFYCAYGTCIEHYYYDLMWGSQGLPTHWYVTDNYMTGKEEQHEGRPQAAVLNVEPNPFTRDLAVKFEIRNSKSEMSLRVFDAAGRLVRQFNHSTIQPFNQVVWSGDDQKGRALPAGVYLIVLASGGKKLTQKVVLLK